MVTVTVALKDEDSASMNIHPVLMLYSHMPRKGLVLQTSTAPYKIFSMAANTDTMSWQSLFWAIVPIALNAMSQPSGRILGHPSTMNFTLRCSPVLCAASAIDSIVRVIAYTISEGSFPDGVKLFTAVRFSDRRNDDDGSFNSMRKNTLFRTLLFVLGVVPQLVKIYATRGIPWTLAWCTAFLATYVVDQVIVLFAYCLKLEPGISAAAAAPRMQTQYRIRGLRVYRLYTRMFLWSSYAFASGFFAYGLESLALQSLGQRGLQASATLIILAALVLCFVAYSVGAMVVFALTARMTMKEIFGLLAVFLMALGLLTKGLDGTGTAHGVINGIGNIVAFASSLCAIETFNMTTTSPRRTTYLRYSLGVNFVGLHFAAAALYYGLVYDPSTTAKPTWTNWLG
ncbi:hypothetical protein LTR85_001815 [Meristemomyces frigidus]|nr:hypothetical protein LTR85_001815 [Meristemomyces frigidus]